MEGSESEAVFEKLNFNPQLFINEAFNLADQFTDEAFHYFHQEASRLLNIDDVDRSQDLKSGINYVQRTIQESLDKRLSLWEQYCLRHCFAVPSGFSLSPENGASDDDAMDQDDTSDEQMDAQLDSLRSKLAEARKECSQLNQELKELESESAFTNQCATAVNEALQLYDNCSAQDVFQEMLKVASELRRKMDQLKTKPKEDMDHNHIETADTATRGFPNLKPDTLQGFITEMNL